MTLATEPADLDAVRRDIDTLDQELVAVLVRRQHLVARAAKFKRSDSEVLAPERVVAVVTRAQSLAAEAGGSGALVGRIFESMVAEFIAFEGHERRGAGLIANDARDNSGVDQRD